MSDEVQQIKDKIDLVSFISQYLELKKSGRNYKGLCPFHNEKTPSFMVSPQLQIFKCFGCLEGGDVIKFVMRREGLQFREALEELAPKAGVKLRQYSLPAPEESRRERILTINSLAAQFYHYLLTTHKVGGPALAYLRKRGLKAEMLKKFLLGYAPNTRDSLVRFLAKKNFSDSEMVEAGLALIPERGGLLFDRFRSRVVFPLFDVRGRVIGFTGRLLKNSGDLAKYVNSPETPVFRKGEYLYGLNLARPSIKKAGRVILVEGQMDLISNVQAGVENVVATSGTALTPSQVQLLAKVAKAVVFCFDEDQPGQSALERAAEICEKEGLVSFVAKLPGGVKDPDEAVMRDADGWKKSLDHPIPLYDYLLDFYTQGVLGSDSLGKRFAVEKLLPVFSRVASSVQRSDLIKRLAQRLDLGEYYLQEAVAADSKNQDSKKDRPKSSARLAVLASLSGQSRLEVLRQYLLGLLLRFDLNLTKKFIVRISQKDFADSRFAPIFPLVKKALGKAKKSIKVGPLRESLVGSDQVLLEELLLFDLGAMEDDLDLQKREIEVVLSELKKELLKAQVRDYLTAIKKAEAAGEFSELASLQKELNLVYRKLKD